MTTDHLDRQLRHTVQLEATVNGSDGSRRATCVTDLSLDGCCISGFYAIGEYVELKIRPIGNFRAQVRWAVAGKAGLRFTRKREVHRGRIVADESGAVVIEYCVAAALIALALLAALMNLGQESGENWNEVNNAVSSDGGIGYNSA